MAFGWLRRWREKRNGENGLDDEVFARHILPSMPDFMNARGELIFHDGNRVGILVQDVPTIAEGVLGRTTISEAFRITFPFALVVIDMESGFPERIVALESGAPPGSVFLCMYKGNAHHNFGEGKAYLDRDAFLARALELVGKTRDGLAPAESRDPGSSREE